MKAIAVEPGHHTRGGQRRGRGAVPRPGQGHQRGPSRRLRRLRMLQQAIVDREEQGETLSRMLPGGWPRSCATTRPRCGRDRAARGHRAHVGRARLLGDRGADRPDRARRPAERAPGGDERARSSTTAGTVMQYVGDAVMAVFGAPFPQRGPCRRARSGRAARCISVRRRSTRGWAERAWSRSGWASACRPVRSRPPLLGSRRAARVHPGRRHRQPRPAAAGLARPAGSTVAERRHPDGCRGRHRGRTARVHSTSRGDATPVVAHRWWH